MLLHRYPTFFQALGAALYKVGGLGLIAGAFTQVGKLAAVTGMADQPPATDIARLLPGVWTWWISETFADAAVYISLAGAGACWRLSTSTLSHYVHSAKPAHVIDMPEQASCIFQKIRITYFQ